MYTLLENSNTYAEIVSNIEPETEIVTGKDSPEMRIERHMVKAFPLQAWRDPWGSRRLRLLNF
jgi:hypothetical protein